MAKSAKTKMSTKIKNKEYEKEDKVAFASEILVICMVHSNLNNTLSKDSLVWSGCQGRVEFELHNRNLDYVTGAIKGQTKVFEGYV